jgi:Flp pilus assembly protein TadG
MNERKPGKPKESGQSLVEMAMSILFLTLLVAGVVDLGRAFFTYIALRDAAQEGAAFASIARDHQTDVIDSAYCLSIVNRAQDTSNTQIVDLTQTTVNVVYGGVACGSASNSNACFGQTVQVFVTYPNFPLATPFLGALLGSQTIPIQASIIDTVLTPPCH